MSIEKEIIFLIFLLDIWALSTFFLLGDKITNIAKGFLDTLLVSK